MLRKRGLWSPRVESNQGFVVFSPGFHSVEYREGGRRVHVQAERTLNKREIMLFCDRPATWEKPFDGTPISESEWQRILQNVTDALEFMGMEVDVLPPSKITPEMLAAFREEFRGPKRGQDGAGLRRSRFTRNKVESTDGFVVQAHIGAGEVFYWEGSKKLRLYAAELMGGVVEFILPESSQWEVGGSMHPVAPADRERVLKNVGRALEYLGIRLDDRNGGPT